MTPESEIQNRKKAFEARSNRYRELGYDRREEARFATASAGPIAGPALDVGTGKGFVAIALARLGIEVVSVDVDADEQAVAALLARESEVENKIKFICGDARQLPFPEGHFGCAVMMDVLHHLADATAVLKEMARVLKPNGIFIAADFSAEGFDLVARVHRAEGREHPRSDVTLEGARRILEELGFGLVRRCLGHYHHVIALTKKATGAS